MTLTPDTAIELLKSRLSVVTTELLSLHKSIGRVLACPLMTTRPSPSCDVSAMDGYALRLADLAEHSIPLAGICAAGSAPQSLPDGECMKIFTGAAIPIGTELVIRREDVIERNDYIELTDITRKASVGLNIRRCGENLTAGAVFSTSGRIISPATIAAAATAGISHLQCYRPLRIGIIITGDELAGVSNSTDAAKLPPWMIYDSNGPGIESLLCRYAWMEVASPIRVRDDLATLTAEISNALKSCDALLLTGGVSMGDLDHVPAACNNAGVQTLFHKLPIRPGRPIFAGLTSSGQIVFGLPGNPVSAMVTARRFALPALAHRAGLICAAPRFVTLTNPDDRTLDLWWYRAVSFGGRSSLTAESSSATNPADGDIRPPVVCTADGAHLLPNRGSGDILSLAESDGFVEISAGQSLNQPLKFFPWEQC